MAANYEGIEFVDDREREIFARAELGETVLAFLRSDVGRYLHGRCKTMLEQAKEDMLTVDTERWFGLPGRRRMRKLQRQADIAQTFMKFLGDALVDGQHAAVELKEYRE